jgi:NitT/TauT family transport system substrate-binding protein
MKFFNYLFLIMFILPSLPGCTQTPPPEPLKIALQSIWPSYGAAFIAQEKGLFAKYGVQVTLLPTQGYMESITSYKEGKVDGAFMVLVDAITIFAEGVPSHFIYATDYSETGDVIVGHPTLHGLTDLKGKTVAFEGFNTFSHLFVVKTLERVGVAEGEFQVINLEAANILAALDANQIAAGHVIEPFTSQALAKGYKIIGKAGDIAHLITSGLVFNTAVIKQRHAEVQGVVNALVEGMTWLQTHPQEGFNIVAKFAAISPNELQTGFNRLHIYTWRENKEILKPQGILFAAGREIIDFFYQKGMLVKIPDLTLMIDNRFIEAVKEKP